MSNVDYTEIMGEIENLAHDIQKTTLEIKTRNTIERIITRNISALYNNEIDLFEFVDNGGGVLSDQMNRAVIAAARKMGIATGIRAGGLSEYDLRWLETLKNEQYYYLLNLGNQIQVAKLAGKPIDSFLKRVPLWGQLWEYVYNKALLMFGKTIDLFRWMMGETIEHCTTCLTLHGQVATREHWMLSGWEPQSRKLECEGWKCKCRFVKLSKKEARNLRSSGWTSSIPVA